MSLISRLFFASFAVLFATFAVKVFESIGGSKDA
jgi:hypothetical protein